MKKLTIIFLALCIVGVSFGVTGYIARLNNGMSGAEARAIKFGNMLSAMNTIFLAGDVLVSDPALSAGTSDTAKVKMAATKTWFDGSYLALPAAEKAFTATGHDIVAGKYATYKLSVKSDSTLTLTKSAATYTTADSARNALAATPANEISLGYVLVQAVGAFDASTTKLNSDSVAVTYVDADNYIFDLTQ